jgi:hypothetical protein
MISPPHTGIHSLISDRYVIDYYHDESGVTDDKTPLTLMDSSSIKSIKVDVRPALDSVDSFLDRAVRMPYEQFNNTTKYDPPPFRASTQMGTAPPFTKFKEPKQTAVVETPPLLPLQLSTTEINTMLQQIETDCRKQKDELALCTSEEACGSAAVALQRCSAMVVCPTIAKEFDSLVKKMSEQKEAGDESVKGEDLSKSYDAMTGCLESFALSCFSATDDVDEEKKK